jgi:aspartate carbamoyltransferase catalytic subunit
MLNRELRYKLRGVDRDTFLGMPVKQRLKYLDGDIVIGEDGNPRGNGEPYHFIYAQSFSKAMLYRLCELAEAIRVFRDRKGKDGAQWLKGLLPHKRVIGLFNQESSRTETSFQAAAQILGMDVVVKNLSTSSQRKGESWADSIGTFSSYADALFVRHSEPLKLEEAVWVSNQNKKRIPIINAGSGPAEQPDMYQHPTQMLLDVYTLWRSFEQHGGMDGRTFVFCGDLNARVARSLVYASRHFPPKKIYLVCPPGRELKPDMIDFLKRRGIPHEYCGSLGDIIGEAEVIYMIRIQDEYDKGGSAETRPLADNYRLVWAYRDRILKHARVLHALPKRNEIDPEYDYADDPHHQFVYNRYQMQNGQWMRAAIFAYLFRVEKDILEERDRQYG